ncbi:hypothetical protein [Haliangium ochraceum]|uniref:Uncharacterized protein n=1 Tax=Haliangium ochraceum (strain DSM 14365 / JCM 11303 / SMP-2) TaxID=502025 RepID=D0LW95_HALO1|nr:hypothetical protein [Haliangium ochraceum]ACY16027.1 hypothetical protein Hoch_3525 [Haliangium ochraceum DSM 14365]
MKYLYGDATPFPLEENFIETLAAATDACVGLFQLDLELQERRDRATALNERASEEIGYLDALAKSLEKALSPMISDEPVFAAQRTATAIARGARTSIEAARDSVVRERESGVRSTFGSDLAKRMKRALAGYLVRHQLPQTRWSVRWQFDPATQSASLYFDAVAECELLTSYRGTVPATERWAVPQRISDIDPNTGLSVLRDAGWFTRLFKGSYQNLSDYYITAVAIGESDARFRVHRSLKPDAEGFEIAMRGEKLKSPQVFALDKGDEPIPVQGDDAANLMQMFRHIEGEMRALVRHRDQLEQALFRGEELADIGEPGEIAEAILLALAPIVREMRRRSRVPGELVLKRDLGNGRREELFVPRQALEDKFASLPVEQQRYFQAAGIGGEATTEFLNRTAPKVPEPDLDDPSEEIPTQVPQVSPVRKSAGDVAAA